MARIYRGAYQCPFFRHNSKNGFSCEAGEISFPDQKTARDHSFHYCANEAGWRLCSLAKTLQRYYDRKEGEEHGKS
jgi:hypothetical protein